MSPSSAYDRTNKVNILQQMMCSTPKLFTFTLTNYNCVTSIAHVSHAHVRISSSKATRNKSFIADLWISAIKQTAIQDFFLYCSFTTVVQTAKIIYL